MEIRETHSRIQHQYTSSKQLSDATKTRHTHTWYILVDNTRLLLEQKIPKHPWIREHIIHDVKDMCTP